MAKEQLHIVGPDGFVNESGKSGQSEDKIKKIANFYGYSDLVGLFEESWKLPGWDGITGAVIIV
jgi:hypothetical protein